MWIYFNTFAVATEQTLTKIETDEKMNILYALVKVINGCATQWGFEQHAKFHYDSKTLTR